MADFYLTYHGPIYNLDKAQGPFLDQTPGKWKGQFYASIP